MQGFYQKQNQAISVYILRSKRSDVFKVGLTLHFLYSKMVSAWTQRNLATEKIGLSDYSSRSDWREDAANLMAEVQKSSWSECYHKYSVELKKAETLQFSLFRKAQTMGTLDKLSGKKRATLKDWRKMDARRRAIYQACNKLSPLFDGYGESLQGSRLPFQHQHRWEKTRQRWKNWGKL